MDELLFIAVWQIRICAGLAQKSVVKMITKIIKIGIERLVLFLKAFQRMIVMRKFS